MSDVKNALRAMLNGVMTEDTIKLAEKTNKVVEKLDGHITTKQHKKNRYDEEEDDIDFMSEAKKKLNEARKMGLDGVAVVEQKKDVSTEQIEALLKGGIKKAKEVTNTPKKELLSEKSDPMTLYTPKSKNDEMSYSKVSELVKIILQSDDGKKMVKQILKEILLESKKAK